MNQDTYAPNVTRMYALLVPATAYLACSLWWPTLTGVALFDGSVGVILGLYICSHPAANGIDLFFLQRAALRRVTSNWSGVGWLLLNALVMLIGWLVIVFGAARFTQTHAFQT
jgi:hypothetical protein